VIDAKESYKEDTWIEEVEERIKENREEEKLYTKNDVIVRYRGWLCIRNYESWREKLLKEIHNSIMGAILAS
jgi:hypothetical protein